VLSRASVGIGLLGWAYLSTTCLVRSVKKGDHRSGGFVTDPRKLLIWWPMVTDHPFSSSPRFCRREGLKIRVSAVQFRPRPPRNPLRIFHFADLNSHPPTPQKADLPQRLASQRHKSLLPSPPSAQLWGHRDVLLPVLKGHRYAGTVRSGRPVGCFARNDPANTTAGIGHIALIPRDQVEMRVLHRLACRHPNVHANLEAGMLA
jgi:hypothetical protein